MLLLHYFKTVIKYLHLSSTKKLFVSLDLLPQLLGKIINRVLIIPIVFPECGVLLLIHLGILPRSAVELFKFIILLNQLENREIRLFVNVKC